MTRDEFTRFWSDTEAGNELANRFIWGVSWRSQVLPEGGGTPCYGNLVEHLHNTIELGSQLGLIERDEEATRA